MWCGMCGCWGRIVACDPRDQSELVVAVWDVCGDSKQCWGVFDVDSYDVGSLM